jgi:membrane-associated phospholipid phosphatase
MTMTPRIDGFAAVALMLASAAAWPSARAQCDSTSRSDTIAAAKPATSTARAALVSRSDVIGFAGAVVATGLLAPFDHDIQRSVRAEDLRDNRGLHRAANMLAFSGGPGPFVAGGVLYLVGETVGSNRLAALGVTMTESVIMAAALNGLVKGAAGRALPNATSSKPGHFSFGRGFHEDNGSFVSFPSGHTAASFAAATVIADEASTWSPNQARLVASVAYSAATLVALSRLYQNVHWASDLPLGAAIGVWSGNTVVAWQHRHPDNWLARRILGIDVMPAAHGVSLDLSLPLHMY